MPGLPQRCDPVKDENGKQISLHVDDAKFKGSVHSIFGCTDCHSRHQGLSARSHSGETGMRHLPRRPANRLRSRRPRQSRSSRQHQRRQVPGLPRQRARNSAASDPKSKVAHTNIPANLRRLPRSEVCYGLERHEFRSLHLVSGECAWQGGRRRISRKLPSAPIVTASTTFWAQAILSRRSTSSMFPPPAPSVTPASSSNMCRAFTAGHRPRQLAGAGLHRLPRHPHHQGAQGCEFVRRRRQCEEHLRGSAMRACGCPRSSACRADALRFVPGQLSRHGFGGRIQHGRQLRQLSRRAQYSAVQRSALDHQSCEPGQDLRPVPSRRQRQVHHHAKFTWTAPRRPMSAQDHRADQEVLPVDDLSP